MLWDHKDRFLREGKAKMGSWVLRRQQASTPKTHQRRAAEPPFGRLTAWTGRWPFVGLLPSWKAEGRAGGSGTSSSVRPSTAAALQRCPGQNYKQSFEFQNETEKEKEEEEEEQL